MVGQRIYPLILSLACPELAERKDEPLMVPFGKLRVNSQLTMSGEFPPTIYEVVTLQ